MVHATFVKNVSMSLIVTVLSITISAVWSITMITWCTHSSKAFTQHFLTLVGLALCQMGHIRFQRKVWIHSNCHWLRVDNLGTDWTRYCSPRYLSLQMIVKVGYLRYHKCWSALLPPCTYGNAESSTTSNSTILSQFVACSIIVRHISQFWSHLCLWKYLVQWGSNILLFKFF